MVSGLVTSLFDQLRIFSGEARLIRMESKSAIKFALSYGEDLYIRSPIKANSEVRIQNGGRSYSEFSNSEFSNSSLSRPRARYPGSPAASSSAPRPDTATATRGSGR